jgi:hypothetical protein
MATLQRLLGEPDAGLIEEWAGIAAARGRRVAEQTVPALLDWWSRQPRRKDVVFAVCGERAAWLASLNPAWRAPAPGHGVPADADEAWQTGTTPERVSLLLAVRRHDPARALALVRSTWGSDGADDRRRFVEALADGLTMDDEPFLEAALDNKSKAVRRAAAAVLGRLPGSRHKARLNALARSVIVVEARKGLLRRSASVSLEPPKEFDKAWERDGLEEQPAGGTGKRAWWLRQILGAADPSAWTEAAALDPEALLEAISGDDYFDDALEAIVRALGLRPDAAWAGPVLRRPLGRKSVEPEHLAGLVAPLKPEESRPLLLEAAAHARFGGARRWRVLALAGPPWPREFSAAALGLLAGAVPREGEAWALHEPVDRVSRAVSPELAEEFVETVLAAFPGQPTDSVKRSIDRARLRADMHKEFGP